MRMRVQKLYVLTKYVNYVSKLPKYVNYVSKPA